MRKRLLWIVIAAISILSLWDKTTSQVSNPPKPVETPIQKPAEAPTLSLILTKTIVFLYEDKEPIDTAKVQGTGFIVGYPVPGKQNRVIPLIVTAKHVLTGRSSIVVRYSPASGATPVFRKYNIEELRKSGDFWEHPDEGVDVVAFRTLFFEDTKIETIPMELIASKNVYQSENIDVMDRVMLPSLMVRFPGSTQNYPIFRDGTIAMIPDEPITFSYPLVGKIIETKQQVILINSTVNPGFSGAPVLLWPGPRLVHNSVLVGTKPWLLGTVSGFFPQDNLVMDDSGKPIAVTLKQPGITGIMNPEQQTMLHVAENSAIGVVTPSWRLLEILESDVVRKRIQVLVSSSIN